MKQSDRFLTIVTVNRNNREGLKRTVLSIQNVISDDIEWVLIDGASGDGSFEYATDVLGSHSSVLLVSEQDEGIYHAMNKGLNLATGIWVLFLNSGDSLVSEGAFQSALNSLVALQPTWMVGGVRLTKNDVPYTIQHCFPFSPSNLELGRRSMPHQATFYGATELRALGGYLEHFGSEADQIANFEFLRKYGPPSESVELIADFEVGGIGQIDKRPGHFALAMWRYRRLRGTYFRNSFLIDSLATALVVSEVYLKRSVGVLIRLGNSLQKQHGN